jgi:hypothetical protein
MTTARELLVLVLRDADTRGLPETTKYSIGFWMEGTGDWGPQFNARLGLTLGEIRAAVNVEKGDES